VPIPLPQSRGPAPYGDNSFLIEVVVDRIRHIKDRLYALKPSCSPAEHEDRKRGRAGVGTNLPQHFYSVHPRHPHLENQKVRVSNGSTDNAPSPLNALIAR
jgi:hypothetical protein